MLHDFVCCKKGTKGMPNMRGHLLFCRRNPPMPPNDKPRSTMARKERAIWYAAIAALTVHLVALVILEYGGRISAPQTKSYASVDFVDFEAPETRTMEEAVRERLEARMQDRISNVSADRNARIAGDIRSSRADEAAMSEEVEAELRAFEQAAFDALADGRKNTDNEGVSRPERDGAPIERYDGWEERVAGKVTAEYDLGGRKALHLNIPGYRCQGGGVVKLAIVVSPGGDVLEASLMSIASEGEDAMANCLESEAFRSVRQCRFQSRADAPRRQSGTLTYRFISQ